MYTWIKIKSVLKSIQQKIPPTPFFGSLPCMVYKRLLYNFKTEKVSSSHYKNKLHTYAERYYIGFSTYCHLIMSRF